MLTRLRVTGFKNLVDVDVYFGPFTCIAGANGVGKSNLFDAITFLSALADRPLIDAARSVRDEGGRSTDVRSLFHRVGDQHDDEMSFEAEMIVPSSGQDDLGQEATASITFLRYVVKLASRKGDSARTFGPLELIHEELVHINLGDAREHLPFAHSVQWRKSAVHGRRTSPFISTETEGAQRYIKLHQDGGSSGRPLSRLAPNLPRTVLSVASAAESPTALLARREMQSWRLLQLEPASLRKPDDFNAPVRMKVDGSHLAATLYHLARTNPTTEGQVLSPEAAEAQVYGHVGSRLAELIDDISDVWVDRDERRELLTLHVADRAHTSHPARALSDGTLRFLALAVLEMEPESHGVLCLEEPENGIHPERIPAMLRLLQDIATDSTHPIAPGNSLRQVIINTHAPAVVAQVPEDTLLVAELKEVIKDSRRFRHVCFSPLPNTWRTRVPEAGSPVSLGKLLAYLNPFGAADDVAVRRVPEDQDGEDRRTSSRRVVERDDVQLMLPFVSEDG